MAPTSFDQYQVGALATAIGTGELAVIYEAVGLVGEASEVAEIALAELTGTPVDSALVGELGAVCWYAAALTAALGLPLSAVTGTDDVEEFAADARSAESLAALGLGAAALELTVACGRLLETVKKAARGDDGPRTLPLTLSAARTATIIELVATVLARVAGIAEQSGATLADALEANAAKLARRRANDTITGDGSAR